MSDEQLAFIRQIVVQPDDLMPRLIYADWLEERGDPQGEFIRIQCELAGEGPDFDRRQALELRERELFGRHRTEWIAEIGPGIQWYEPRHGFIESLIVTAAALAETKGDILNRAPVLGLGTVCASADEVRLLASLPALRYLRTLRLGGSQLGDGSLATLLASPNFPELRALWLTNCRLGPRDVERLVASPRIGQLEVLVLSENPIGDAGAVVIAGAAAMKNLHSIRMENCGIEASGIEALIASTCLESVKSVHVGITAIRAGRLHSRFQQRFGRNSF